METTRKYSMDVNSKSQTMFSPLISQSRMYSTHHSNPDKSTLETMNATNQSLNPPATMPAVLKPKKGNKFQNAFNSLTNILIDQFSKVPASIINNFSNINNTLSVTIVPNEGIISHEFFKTLTSNKDNLSDKMYIQSMQSQEPPMDFVDAIRLNSKVQIPKDEFLKMTSDSKFPAVDDFDLCLDTEPMFLYEKPFDNKEIIKNQFLEKEISESNKSNMIDKHIPVNEIVSEDKLMSLENMQIPNSSLKESTEEKASPKTSLLSHMWKTVVDGVSNHFRPLSSGSEDCSRKYQTRRKPNYVSSGRGRGRGKSQLRRNGVCQNTHRKATCKRDILSDIKDDLETWETFENYNVPINSLEENEDPQDVVKTEEPYNSLNFELIDFKPKKIKERKDLYVEAESFSMQVKYVPECPLEEREANCTIEKTACRVRKISEASVDSEDSFIVFETACKSDSDDTSCSDEDDTSDHRYNCSTDKTACRVRKISEASVDSEDSFIVFESACKSDSDDSNCSDEDDTNDHRYNCTADKTACRVRKISEASVDSADSFIVFETACKSDFDDTSCSDEDDTNDYRYNCTADKTACRVRKISEASVDSEDNFIVFESNCESDFNDDSCSDEDDTNDSESETESESETDDSTPTRKVRFNLKPTIHCMVTWNFAHRAARVGPWETMARDRERFKGRISQIGRVVGPVLTSDFRTKIWKERFTTDE